MRSVIKEFKEFALKGNMLDLAIGFILGAAFSAVVTALSKGVLMQLISAIVGKPDFSNVKFTLGTTPILVGDLITALINFLLIAAVLFLLIKAVNRAVVKPKPVEQKKSRDCPYCLTAIPLAATKCSACTSAVEPVAAG
jgi:large conductance mechanosensitive channel